MSVELFSSIFDGLKQAYGTYKIDRKQSNGKSTGRAGVIREPRTTALWEGHLSGKGDSVGIIPINEENMCIWGCIDVDQYPLDHKALVEKIQQLKLPLVICRSKSGGAHLFLFTSEWVSAKEMQEVLNYISASLGYGGSEVFPKQIELHLSRGDVGNFLNLPYYDHEDGLRYAFLADGTAATLNEFFVLYKENVQTREQMLALTVEEEKSRPVADGPPCLQHLCAEKISEGGRNNALFNLGVYLRKAKPDTWETDIQSYNLQYLDPPLPLNEVMVVAKQVEKKDYAYRCKEPPINAFCNADLCRTRKFGIDAASTGTVIANLRKYNSQPPIWFLDVNGVPLELDTDGLMNQPSFQRSCVEQLNYLPRSLAKPAWETRINALLTDMQQTEGSVVEVSEDASTAGQFYEYLEEWCTSRQMAAEREEILLRKPYTDEEDNLIYFRLKDLTDHLKKVKFSDYKTHKIAQRLRDINGQSTQLKIKGKTVRVWSVPAYGQTDLNVEPPSFEKDEPPF